MALVSEVGVLFLGLPVWDEIYGEVSEDVLVVDVLATILETRGQESVRALGEHPERRNGRAA